MTLQNLITMEIKQNIKPLSVNQCWRGRRFKTPDYKSYEKELLYKLPNYKIPESRIYPPYEIYFEFGFSKKASDIDNPIKPLQDILQKKYDFDDKDIYKLVAQKFIVKEGEEYFKVKIKHYINN